MIEKKDLEGGEYYLGKCRNAHVALWTGQVFIYLRTKFGSTFADAEKIFHPEDDDGYDLFIPLRKLDTDLSDEDFEQIHMDEQKYT